MKELYSFLVKRKIKQKVSYEKENKKGDVVEAFKTKTKTISNRVIFQKPSFSDIEEAEYFYGQKYNELINSGYLTRLMLNKKLGDIGGTSSKLSEEVLQKAFLDNVESARTIQFYEGQKDLDEDQTQKLEEAKELFVSSQKIVADIEEVHRSQYNQTAEAKAEQKIIEWFIFNFSFYGDDYDSKREHYLILCEDEDDIEDKDLLKNKGVFDQSFLTLARVANLWYNKMGSDQKEIEEQLEKIFPNE
jgi:hypothetical protein